MKSAKLKVSLVAFDFSMMNVHSVVETCMYNKVEIKDVNSNRIIKRKEYGILSDVHLLADFYDEFSTDKNLSILANAIRSLVPVHASVNEAISMLSSIADIPLQIAEKNLMHQFLRFVTWLTQQQILITQPSFLQKKRCT